MVDTSSSASDHDQEFFAALGRIVFWATYLELDAALLRAGIQEVQPDLPVEALARQGLVNRLIEDVDDARRHARGPRVRSLLDEIRSWADTAQRLLDERNRHVHAFWYLDLAAGPRVIMRGEHPKSGDLIDATPAKMDDLVDRL
jgi:hypothetical protein